MSLVDLGVRGANSKSWNKIFDIINAYALSEALYTAVELDLFGALERHGPLALEELAEALSLKVIPVRTLLLGVCATQLIERDARTKKYKNSEAASEFLVEGVKHDLRSYVRFSALIQRNGMTRLTESVRGGCNYGLELFSGAGNTLYERMQGREELEDLFQEALSVYSEYLLGHCLPVEEFQGLRSILDVGGGDGTTAVRLCKEVPGLNVTVLEKPSVCMIGRDKVAAAGLADHITFCEGNAFEDTWPAGHDAIFMGHFPEIFAVDRVRQLYSSAFESLGYGGLLFLWVAVADDDETGGRQAAKTSMYFLSTASGEGLTYPISDHVELLRNVGFAVKNVYRFGELEHACIVAVRNCIPDKSTPHA